MGLGSVSTPAQPFAQNAIAYFLQVPAMASQVISSYRVVA
jgi:hypothetical protein